MKYIINESGFERVIFNFLDFIIKDFTVMDNSNKIPWVTQKVIFNEDGDTILVFTDTGYLYIGDFLFESLARMFGLSWRESLSYVRLWFENRFDLEVKQTKRY